MRTWIHQKGVTLLELVIGLVLFGIIAWGFTAALIPSLKNMTKRSDDPEVWLHEARSCAESIIKDCEQEDICNDQGKISVSECNLIDCDSIAPTSEPFQEPTPEYCEIKISDSPNDDYEDIILRLPLQ